MSSAATVEFEASLTLLAADALAFTKPLTELRRKVIVDALREAARGGVTEEREAYWLDRMISVGCDVTAPFREDGWATMASESDRTPSAATTVAAIYVQKGGAYFGLPGVDPWDEERDAMRYAGPWPVVAHPPCNHWCQLASVNAARYETFHIGDDGGRFAAALDAVNEYGGVLEHPAHSLAWPYFDLEKPQRGSWQRGLWQLGWVTEISQSAYGCPARKRTWLYYVGDEPAPLDWRDPRGEAVIGGGINSGECVGRRKIEKREASATPTALRDVLLDLARSARMGAVA